MDQLFKIVTIIALCIAAGDALKVRSSIGPELHVEVPVDPEVNGPFQEGVPLEVELSTADLQKAGVPLPLAIAASLGGRRGTCIIGCRFGPCRAACRIPL